MKTSIENLSKARTSRTLDGDLRTPLTPLSESETLLTLLAEETAKAEQLAESETDHNLTRNVGR